MSSPRPWLPLLSAAAGVLLLTMPPSAAGPSDVSPAGPAPDGPACTVGSGARPAPRACDRTGAVITYRSPVDGETLAAAVPGAGEAVSVTATLDDGGHLDLSITHAEDGSVLVEADADDTAARTSGPARCTDDAFNLMKFSYDLDGNGTKETTTTGKWQNTLNWWFKASSTPSNMTSSQAQTAIAKGATNITTAKNDCNLADNVSATHAYNTTTGSAPDFSPGTPNCSTSHDGLSIVGFGDLGSNGKLAVTCVWGNYYAGKTTIGEADLKFDTSGRSWYIPGTTPCNSTGWSLNAVATHEWGHAFGLAHVAEDGHGYLTMSPKIDGQCQNSEATLGLGDVRGLESIY